MNNDEKLKRLIDLDQSKNETVKRLKNLKEVLEIVERKIANKGNVDDIRIEIAKEYSCRVSMPVPMEIIKKLITDTENTLELIEYDINDLLNGEANGLKKKFSTFANEIKEREKDA